MYTNADFLNRQIMPRRDILRQRALFTCCGGVGRILRSKNPCYRILLFLNGDIAMANVLCTGADAQLMRTRVLILEQAGHRVTAATSVKAVESACAAQDFDVTVIGQGVSTDEKQRIFGIVRESCPTTKILELYTFAHGKTLAKADDWLEIPLDTPPELAQKVERLAGE